MTPAAPLGVGGLAAIGLAAGCLSGMFGVGGGIVIVPLLVLWAGFDERRATATSLAAIIVIASCGAAVQASYGNVHVLECLMICVPAVAGVVFGTWLQQRIPRRAVAALTVVALVATAIELIVP